MYLEVLISLSAIIFSTQTSSALELSRNDFYKDLAAYHAPVIYQETGSTPKADAITRFDFDGDLVGNNNWNNITTAATPAYVYYDVIESETHYFITYAFYHARDYDWVCFWRLCHENDLEGVFVTVKKIPGNLNGEVILVSTVAHNHIISYPDPKYTVSPLVDDPSHRQHRIALRIEWGGHGVYTWDENPDNTSRMIYTYGGQADDPKGSVNGIVKYDFLKISSLWNLRDQVGKGKVFISSVDYYGARFFLSKVPGGFAGEKYGTGLANPPWGWYDLDDWTQSPGDWFFDPAYAVRTRMRNASGFSGTYIYNPYLGVDGSANSLSLSSIGTPGK